MSSVSFSSPQPPERPFQFSLRQLLAVTAAIAFASALIFQWGPLGFVVFYVGGCLGLIVWGMYTMSWKPSLTGIGLICFGGCLGLPTTRYSPEAARRMQCGNHLKQIGLALQNYHDVFGSFPPAYIADANGKPMHSWRVLILPFLEQNSLFAEYNFNEPWDGPNNRRLAKEMPACYRCPSRSDEQPKMETSYVAVVGPQTMWPGEKATKVTDITDGTPNTAAIVETENSGIHWMEPRDLSVTQMPMTIKPSRGQGISSPHPNVALAVYPDGHTYGLAKDTPPETLRAILSIAGGEMIGDY
jgi:Protein of unknown function (DUF1559)